MNASARRLEATLRQSSYERVRFVGPELELDLRRGLPAAPVAPAPPRSSMTTLYAPSLGTLELLVEVDDIVVQGQVVARLRIHRRTEELQAPAGGRVHSMDAASGDLVEHGGPLLTITSD
ncbi:MAG: hypothetical protein JJT89_16455 [Nitriliruptoraceae bacterium]|nr:hypothetical protein [Nitriliruptoraceae bacterium]